MKKTSVLTVEQAMIELSIVDAETREQSFEEFVVRGIASGIPVEVLTRMKELWEQTKEIGGELIHVGKIILKTAVTRFRLHDFRSSAALAVSVYPDFDTFEAQFCLPPSNGVGFRGSSCQKPRYMDCCFS